MTCHNKRTTKRLQGAKGANAARRKHEVEKGLTAINIPTGFYFLFFVEKKIKKKSRHCSDKEETS